jgi:trk system potassium uptake protein TrkH
MAFFLLNEFANPLTMGGMTWGEKLLSSFFHSVTTRTAGFNSLPLNEMTNMSKIGTVLLMFIGGAPGSTAGGVKVTTFALLLIAIISNIRGSDEVVVSKHRIASQTVFKAITIIFLAALLIGTVTFLLMYFDPENHFLNNLYETTSAFGTVGLSTVGSYTLSVPSKLLITMTMFLGKIGPLGFAIAVSMRSSLKARNIVRPEGKIIVG